MFTVGDRIILRADEPAKQSQGGILLPDSPDQKPTRGVVVSVGNGRLTDLGHRIPIDFQVGQRITFVPHSGFRCDVNGEEFVVIRESDVLLVEE